MDLYVTIHGRPEPIVVEDIVDTCEAMGQFKAKIEAISGVAAQDQRLYYRGLLLEDVQTNKKLKKKFRRRISEYLIGKTNVLFAPVLIIKYENDHFAKTGSGQT